MCVGTAILKPLRLCVSVFLAYSNVVVIFGTALTGCIFLGATTGLGPCLVVYNTGGAPGTFSPQVLVAVRPLRYAHPFIVTCCVLYEPSVFLVCLFVALRLFFFLRRSPAAPQLEPPFFLTG